MLNLIQPLSRGQLALRGLLAVVLGAACIVWPGVTVGVVVALFAIYCFADAITQIVGLFDQDETTGTRAFTLVLVLVDIAAAIIAIALPGLTAGALVIVIGLWAIFAGTMQIAAAWDLRGTHLGSGWLSFGGALSVVAGVALIVWPNIGAVTLALVFGVYLLCLGVMLLAGAAVAPRDRLSGSVA